MHDPSPAQILTDVWDGLRQGRARAEHPFRTGALATADALGKPDVRTVVLRKVDAALRVLDFQTDRRSPKVSALQHNGAVAWLFYDPATQVQLRVQAAVVLHGQDEVADAEWAAVPPAAREPYRTPLMPGAAIDAPTPRPPDPASDGREHFTVVRCRVESIEWLRLDDGLWRRLRFTWPNGEARWQWLAP